jgi:hypothetical protein
VTKVQNIINAQVDINRAVFASNDERNGNKLGMNEHQRIQYILECVKSAMASLAQFREDNK